MHKNESFGHFLNFFRPVVDDKLDNNNVHAEDRVFTLAFESNQPPMVRFSLNVNTMSSAGQSVSVHCFAGTVDERSKAIIQTIAGRMFVPFR